jgi:hypothetical protein
VNAARTSPFELQRLQNLLRVRATACAVACLVAWSPTGLSAQVTSADSVAADSVATAHETRAASHYALLAAGALGAATFNQAAAMPAKWKRTWGGYAARVGDQVGFAASEELLRYTLLRVVPAHGPAMRCNGARAGRPFWPRVGRALSCGVVNTLVVRETSGARRPNVPLLGAIVGASALSLTWRPERENASKGMAFVFTRIGVVTGGTAMSGAYGAYNESSRVTGREN